MTDAAQPGVTDAAAPAGGTGPLADGAAVPAAAAVNGGGEPAPADSTAAAESASVTDQPSLLSSAAGNPPEPPAPEAKPAEATAQGPEPSAKPAAEASPDPAQDATPDASAKDEAPAPLTIEDLTLPDGAQADAPDAKAFVDLLNNGELSRKDRGQQLLDLHYKDIERVHREVTERQREFWNNLNRGWQEELRADREIGGNRLQTNLSKAVGVIQEFLPPRDAELLVRHTDANGMGNYPPFIRMMVNIADKLNIFETGLIVSNPAPQAPQRKPGSRGWYDKSIDRVE